MIITSVCEAIEAELGGADRLELVSSLENGGFSPGFEVVRDVVKTVSIPVRVMLRETASMSIGSQAEIGVLQAQARRFAELPIDGLVIGFIRDGMPAIEATGAILDAARGCRATFHRAFDHVLDPARALEQLKTISQIDRVLTSGGEGSWQERKERILEWQRAAGPEIRVIVAAGLCSSVLTEGGEMDPELEVHVGRAARIPQLTLGSVNHVQVASLKRLLG